VSIVAIVTMGAFYLTFSKGGEKVLTPNFSEGDTWTWTVTYGGENENAASLTRTDTVVGKQTKLDRECWIFRSTSADNAEEYSLNPHYVEVGGWYGAGSESYSDNLKTSETIPTGPILSVEFPLEVGKKWIDIRAASGYDNARGIESMDLQMISRGEALSKTTVTVPAGTYQAYKIDFTVLMNGTGTVTVEGQTLTAQISVTVEGQTLTAQISTTITGTRWYSDAVKNFVKEVSDSTMMLTILGQTATTEAHGEMELASYSLGG